MYSIYVFLQRNSDVYLHKRNTWNTKMFRAFTMYVNSRNQVCVPGEVADKGFYIRYIRWFDRNTGSQIKEIKCQCEHNSIFTGSICEHPEDPDVIIETCWECGKI